MKISFVALLSIFAAVEATTSMVRQSARVKARGADPGPSLEDVCRGLCLTNIKLGLGYTSRQDCHDRCIRNQGPGPTLSYQLRGCVVEAEHGYYPTRDADGRSRYIGDLECYSRYGAGIWADGAAGCRWYWDFMLPNKITQRVARFRRFTECTVMWGPYPYDD